MRIRSHGFMLSPGTGGLRASAAGVGRLGLLSGPDVIRC